MDKPPAYHTGPQYAPPPNPMTAPHTTVYMQQPAAMPQSITMPVQYGDQPLPITCPNCHQQVVTEVTYEAGGMTYLAAFGIGVFFWCGCCFIPCCIDGLKDVYHRCPCCKVQLGIHKRL